jgi:seryl-tRNA synthetase
MGDLYSTNRLLIIKRHEYAKSVALSNIQAREIRIMELQEEIERNKEDIEAQKKAIETAEANIKQQIAEVENAKKATAAAK